MFEVDCGETWGNYRLWGIEVGVVISSDVLSLMYEVKDQSEISGRKQLVDELLLL